MVIPEDGHPALCFIVAVIAVWECGTDGNANAFAVARDLNKPYTPH
jgi:hypothetical protein